MGLLFWSQLRLGEQRKDVLVEELCSTVTEEMLLQLIF